MLEILTPVMSVTTLLLSLIWEGLWGVFTTSPFFSTLQHFLVTLAIIFVGAMFAFLMVCVTHSLGYCPCCSSSGSGITFASSAQGVVFLCCKAAYASRAAHAGSFTCSCTCTWVAGLDRVQGDQGDQRLDLHGGRHHQGGAHRCGARMHGGVTMNAMLYTVLEGCACTAWCCGLCAGDTLVLRYLWCRKPRAQVERLKDAVPAHGCCSDCGCHCVWGPVWARQRRGSGHCHHGSGVVQLVGGLMLTVSAFYSCCCYTNWQHVANWLSWR